MFSLTPMRAHDKTEVERRLHELYGKESYIEKFNGFENYIDIALKQGFISAPPEEDDICRLRSTGKLERACKGEDSRRRTSGP